jgi:hypothetical protein
VLLIKGLLRCDVHDVCLLWCLARWRAAGVVRRWKFQVMVVGENN